MRIEISRNVIEHLKKFPFGYPTSTDNDEWKLLEMPFSLTDEEGELLSRLMPYSEHIDDIAKRLGCGKDEILPLLDSLLHKTWLLRTGTRENGRYTAMTWGPGAMELQMPWLGKKLLKLYSKLEPLDQQYQPTELIPHFRVIPRESALPDNSEVLPSEIVSYLIEQADENEIAVTECIQLQFDILSRHTIAAGASLSFARLPIKLHCRKCHIDYTSDSFDLICHRCRSMEIDILSGSELYIESMDAE